jgi:hypothetical protein
MRGFQGLFLALLLVSATLAQTNFKNTCQNSSLIPKLATGVVNLNPLDTYNTGANKDYYVDISLAQFQVVDVLGYGFALSGFQANCGQQYYSLTVDKVDFQNQNTRLSIVVNFQNPTDGTVTTWSLVSFTYIIVSRNLNGAYSDIWASVAEVYLTSSIASASIDAIGAAYKTAPAAGTPAVPPPAVPAGSSICTVYQDPSFVMDFTNCATAAALGMLASGINGAGEIVIHPYIMGFNWNSNKSLNSILAVSIFNTKPNNAAKTGWVANTE